MGLRYPQRALDASYNNVASGLAATNVQEALDELNTTVAQIQIVKATLSGDQTISTVASGAAGANMAQVGSWQATLTTTTTCHLKITVSCNSIATNAELIVGYKLNSETSVPFYYQNHIGTNVRHSISFSDMVSNVAAGTHTVKVMASRAIANCTIYGSANPYYQAVLLVEAIPV